ncbi:MBL fold metallo-hydrolase [uncultured Roseibium sp.]|uniref:MBL fold metallo-hydrolase n=1 Tax=uncultured Roseibium sp. TaxID=1936171 RepID=UPI0032161FAE
MNKNVTAKNDAAKNDTGKLDKKVSFREIGRDCYAFCVDGGSNTGVVVGENSVLVVDAQPTANGSEAVLAEIAKVTDKPVKHVVLTHYHADSSLGAAAFEPGEIITSDLTKRMIDERGQADRATSLSRLPELFGGAKRLPAQIRPTMSFASSMSISLGRRDVRLMHLGRGHTMGDVVVWVPDAGVLFAGDLVANQVASYCGDAHLTDWPRALNRIVAFRPNALMPGRGKALVGADRIDQAVSATAGFLVLLRDTVFSSVQEGKGLKGTYTAAKAAMDPAFSAYADYERNLPFNVARAYDEAQGLDIPQIWTAERDQDLADALRGVTGQAQPEMADEDSSGDDAVVDPDVLDLSLEDVAGDAEAAEKATDGANGKKKLERNLEPAGA